MLYEAPLRKPVTLPLPVSLPFTLSVVFSFSVSISVSFSVSVSISVSFPFSVSVFVTMFVAGLRGNLDGPDPLVINLHRRHICRCADSLLSHRLSRCRGVRRASCRGLERRRMGVGDVKGPS